MIEKMLAIKREIYTTDSWKRRNDLQKHLDSLEKEWFKNKKVIKQLDQKKKLTLNNLKNYVHCNVHKRRYVRFLIFQRKHCNHGAKKRIMTVFPKYSPKRED